MSLYFLKCPLCDFVSEPNVCEYCGFDFESNKCSNKACGIKLELTDAFCPICSYESLFYLSNYDISKANEKLADVPD